MPGYGSNGLHHALVADGEKAKKRMGFIPRYSTKEALLSFIGAQRLREVHLLDAGAGAGQFTPEFVLLSSNP